MRTGERERFVVFVGVRNNGTGWLFSLSPLLALSMSCARCPTPFAQQHLKLLGPPNSGRSVAEWAPSLKRATDACVLASNNASPAQRGPRRDAQPLHATPLAAVLFPAPLRAGEVLPRLSGFLSGRVNPRLGETASAVPTAGWKYTLGKSADFQPTKSSRPRNTLRARSKASQGRSMT